jgi:hypothetical protein
VNPLARRPAHIAEIRRERRGGESRVSAVVDRQSLWFSSADAELLPEPEAFASALLLPSIHRNRRLNIDAAMSSRWIENVGKLTAIWSRWWGYRSPQLDFRRREDKPSMTTSTALAFSCGVDSFYSLFNGTLPDYLVSVHGFDVALADTRRMSAFEASTRAVGSALGIKSLIVRTNLREHPALGPRWLWERGHGGGVAAIGHLLNDCAGEFRISSTYASRNNDTRPWGSSGDTDPLFSSDRVSITHFGDDHSRDEKIKSIADNSLVQNHLRVCWENRAETGNCSRCAKCLAAMLVLAEVGVLDKFTVFDGMKVLGARLDELPYLRNNINIAQRIVTRAQLPSNIEAATRRLIARSRRAAKMRSYRERIRNMILPRG